MPWRHRTANEIVLDNLDDACRELDEILERLRAETRAREDEKTEGVTDARTE